MKILDLYITKLCNLHCEYCYVDIGRDVQVFDPEKFLEIFDWQKYDYIKFFGGEPLLKWKEIQQIVIWIRARKPKMNFSIVTNGMLINAEKISFFEECNISVVISVHPTPGAQDMFALFDRQKIHLNAPRFPLTFSFVLSPKYFVQNIKDITFLMKNGIKNFILLPDSSVLWEWKIFILFQKVLENILRVSEYFAVSIRVAFSQDLVNPAIFCKKTIFDIEAIKSCNRFKKTNLISKDFFQMMQKNLENTGFFSIPERFFYSCPIWYFLDHYGVPPQRIAEAFVRMNAFLVEIQKKLDFKKQSITYLTIPKNSEIRFNLTKQCNLRCNYCYVDFSNEQISFDAIKNIVDYFLESWVLPSAFSFFGGEPLLEFDLLKKSVLYILDKALALNISTPHFKIATNAMLINEEIYDFLQLYNFEIHITLGGTSKNHNFFRDSSYDMVLKKLTRFQIFQNPRVIFLMMIHPVRITEIAKNYIFLRSLGCQKIYLECVYDTENIWAWKEKILQKQFLLIRHYDDAEALIIPGKQKNIFDISVEGHISDNSLGSQYTLSFKKVFNSLLWSIFKK